jgi:PHS family inorganic phosphate transporter-like MFS transporter
VAFKSKIISESLNHLQGVDQAWRTIIGIGCVPAFIALYFRLTIPETPRYTIDVEADVQRGANDANTVITNDKHAILEDSPSDVVLHAQQNSEARDALPKGSFADFRRHFGQWKNFKVLFGAAWSWFALDVAFYGLGLNSAVILQTIGFGPAAADANNPSASLQQTLHNVAVGNIILALGGLLPGYYFTFAFIDSWGRKPIQVSDTASSRPSPY